MKVSPVVRCQGRYNHIITDPRKILLCSLCIHSDFCRRSTVQVSKENEGEILGCPSKEIITGQGLWDTKHLNDRIEGIAYMWVS